MPVIHERRLFEVCLDRSKKDLVLKAIDTYLDRLEKIRASRIVIRETLQLKQAIEKIKIC